MNINDVIEMNKGIILSLMSRFYNVDKEDLYQAGVLGLLKAYQNYHFDGKTKFSSYAYKYIYGEMYLLANNQSIKINHDLYKLASLIEKTRYKLAQKYNRIPSNEEISKFLNIPIKQIDDALLACNQVLSIDNDVNLDVASIQDNDNNILIKQSLKYLTDEEKEIILSRYYGDMTQMEVAKKLSWSQVKVSRYEKRSLNKMHDFMI